MLGSESLLTALLSLQNASFGEVKVVEKPFPSVYLVRRQAWPAICEREEEVETVQHSRYDYTSRNPSGQQALTLEPFLGRLETSSRLLGYFAGNLVLLVDSSRHVVIKDGVDIEDEFNQSTGYEAGSQMSW